MPAIVILFAGKARSYICHRSACDNQGSIRRQPCSDLSTHLVIGDLCSHCRVAFSTYPHQRVTMQF